MKKSIYFLIIALVVGIGARVEGADRICPTGANLDLFIMSGTTAYTYNAVTYSSDNSNAVQDGDVVIVSGACNWSAMINGLPISVTVKADPSLTTRPIITYSLSGTASYFIKPLAAAGKTIVITFDGVDIIGTSPTPKSATGFINSVPSAIGSNTKIVINNCVLRQFATGGFLSTYTANTAGGAPFGDIIITNSRIIGFGYITLGSTANTSPANIILTNSYFGTYNSATLSFLRTTGTSLQVNQCTFNNVGSGSRVLFNSLVSGTNSISNSIFANCTQTGNNTLTPTATGSGNINLSSSANAITGLPGTLATTPALANGTLPAVTSLSTTDSWYYAASGTAGYYNSATFTKSGSTLSGFAYNEGSGPSVAQTFTVTGTDLFNNITVAAPANYEVSSNGTTYASSLSFSPVLGVVTSKTISVRLVAGLTPASYTGDITLSSANLSNQTIALSGTVSAGGSPAFTASTGSLTGFNYIYAQGPSSEQSFTVSGSNLSANVAIAAPTNYEVSTTSGTGFGTSASIPFGSGTLTNVPVYVRLKAGLNSGSYNAENIALTSTGAVEQGVTCSGSVTPPTVTITPTSLTSFFALAGSANPSTEKTFTVGGSNLAGNITLTPPTNYEISTSTGVSFAATNPITLSPSSGSVASTTIYVRLKGSLATASYSENITVSTAGTSDATVACSGVVGTPIVKVGTSAGLDNKLSLALLTYTFGAGPSVSQTGMYVSGDYLQGDVTVNAPTGFEVSKDNTTFSDFVTFTVSNQTVSGQVWNRLKAGLNTDSYTGNVVFSSTSADIRNVAASGSVTGGPQLTLGALQNPASNLNYNYNGESLERTFTITSASLSADVTVTPPTNFEISTTSGSGFTSSPIVIAQATAAAGAQTIYVRTKSGLALGTYAESIVVSTTGANNKSVAVSGTVSPATPTVTVSPIDTYTFNGNPQGPIAATNTGTGSSYTFSYAGTGTTTYDPSATLPTNAGTYTATATVAADGNYVQASSTATAFKILSTGAVTAANTTVSSLTLAPGSVLTVSSGASLIVDANTTVASVTVAQGGSLTVNNGVTLGGTVTLQSNTDGTATLVDKYASPTQAAVVEQYVVAGRNWYVSAPVSAAGFASLNKGNSVVEFNETTKVWDPVTSGTLVPGKGYIQVATAVQGTTGTLSFDGTANSGDITVTLSRTGATAQSGFNLVGNPYPSYLSWSKITKVNTNVMSTAWFRTKTAGGAYVFATVNAADTSSVIVVSNSANTMITKYIPPMQAYWVRLNSGASTTDYTVTNAMRSHADNGSNKMKAPKLNTQQLVRLQVSNAATTDEAVVYFNANAADGYDNYDSPKMSNNSATIPEIYTLAGTEKLVINGMSDVKYDTEIPIGFSTGTAGDFSISANEFSNFENGTRLILLDKNSSTIENELTPETAYHFSAPVTAASTNRFSLLLRAPGTTTDIDNTAKANTQVFVNANNQLVIIAPEKSNYAIYNAVGQMIENGSVGAKQQIANCKLQAGIFVVNVNNKLSKVIIR